MYIISIKESDEQFQDHHQEIGRISGGATSRVATTRTPQPIIRQQQQQQATNSNRRVQSTTRSAQNILQSQSVQGRGRDTSQPKRNRITLAVRPHTPAPELQLETVPETLPINQSILTSLPPPNFVSASSSGREQDRHAALMAQVAAERQSSLVARDTDLSSQTEPDSSIETSQVAPSPRISIGSPLAALSSPTFTQVVAPPAFSQAAAQTVSRQPSVAIPDSRPAESVEQPIDEPIEAPSFQNVLSQGCPRKGVFSWENKDHCDRYYMCTNGTFTEEACPNGLSYSQMGAVYQHCAYNWNVECGNKKSPGPIASPGCPWQFGIFPIAANGQCSIDYYVCEWGVPETKRCQPEGLFYDERIKGCQWADQLGCKSEALLNFKCPQEDEDNPFWPYPRYYHNKQDIIVCVNEQPRLVHCNEEQIVDPGSLSCLELKKKHKKKL